MIESQHSRLAPNDTEEIQMNTVNLFNSAKLDQDSFAAIKDQLIAVLAETIKCELDKMGDSAKGISWFSSVAMDYVETRRAA